MDRSSLIDKGISLLENVVPKENMVAYLEGMIEKLRGDSPMKTVLDDQTEEKKKIEEEFAQSHELNYERGRREMTLKDIPPGVVISEILIHVLVYVCRPVHALRPNFGRFTNKSGFSTKVKMITIDQRYQTIDELVLFGYFKRDRFRTIQPLFRSILVFNSKPNIIFHPRFVRNMFVLDTHLKNTFSSNPIEFSQLEYVFFKVSYEVSPLKSKDIDIFLGLHKFPRIQDITIMNKKQEISPHNYIEGKTWKIKPRSLFIDLHPEVIDEREDKPLRLEYFFRSGDDDQKKKINDGEEEENYLENLKHLGLINFPYSFDNWKDILNLEQLHLQSCKGFTHTFFERTKIPNVQKMKLSHLENLVVGEKECGQLLPFKNCLESVQVLNIANCPGVKNEFFSTLSLPFLNSLLIKDLPEVTGIKWNSECSFLERIVIIRCRKFENIFFENRNLPLLKLLVLRSLPKISGKKWRSDMINMERLRVQGCHKFDDKFFINIFQGSQSLKEIEVSDLPLISGIKWKPNNNNNNNVIENLQKVVIRNCPNFEDTFFQQQKANFSSLLHLKLENLGKVNGSRWMKMPMLGTVEIEDCENFGDSFFQTHPLRKISNVSVKNSERVTGKKWMIKNILVKKLLDGLVEEIGEFKKVFEISQKLDEYLKKMNQEEEEEEDEGEVLLEEEEDNLELLKIEGCENMISGGRTLVYNKECEVEGVSFSFLNFENINSSVGGGDGSNKHPWEFIGSLTRSLKMLENIDYLDIENVLEFLEKKL